MVQAEWEFSQDKAFIVGPLSRGSIMPLWEVWVKSSTHAPELQIDLSKIERIDSAGAVLLIHIIEFEKKHNCHVMISNVPRQLVTLLELSNIGNMYQEHVTRDFSDILLD
ncbi:MAG: STAS domain-containing protein [Vibrio sp.]